MDYRTLPSDELLHALETAGPVPDLDLIHACLERREELTPGLLRVLDEGIEDDWPAEDPRCYRDVHAGLLLIAYREPAALPILARALRDEEREDLVEWLETELPAYGPAAIPMALDLLGDRSASEYLRSVCSSVLIAIALHHPEERERIVAALRALLPALAEDGSLTLPLEAAEEPDPMWVWIAQALAKLRDTASRPQVVALFEQGLMEELVMDLEDYVGLFEPGAPAPQEAQWPHGMPKFYEWLRASEAREMAARTAQEPQVRAAPSHWEMQRQVPPAPAYPDEQGTFVRSQPKTGRNDPCPCGSGRKYKHCCGTRS